MKFKSILMIIVVLCFLSVCAMAEGGASESAQASSMRLMQTEGNVTLTDQSGTKLALRNRMRLYSGSTVSTAEQSRAGILLDDAKAVTIAESSSAVITQEGKKLEIAVNSGKMFFDVSKPLEADESFEIRTSTMVLGIRGTSGCVQAVSERETLVTLITGHAEITCFAGHVVPIEAGQQVRIVKNDDGSCDEQYLEFTKSQEAKMLQEFEWEQEEEHGAIWREWKKQGYDNTNSLSGNNRPHEKKEEKKEDPDDPTRSPNPWGYDGGIDDDGDGIPDHGY